MHEAGAGIGGDERAGQQPHVELVTLAAQRMRRDQALEILRGAGFGKVRSLAGGIDAWAERVETGMARY